MHRSPQAAQVERELRRMRRDQRWAIATPVTGIVALVIAAVTDDPMFFLAYLAVQVLATATLSNRIRRDRADTDVSKAPGVSGTLTTLAATLVSAVAMVAAATVAPEVVVFAALTAPLVFLARNVVDARRDARRESPRKSQTKQRDLTMQSLTLTVMLAGLTMMQQNGVEMFGQAVHIDGEMALIALAGMQLLMAVNAAVTYTGLINRTDDQDLINGMRPQRTVMIMSHLAQGATLGILATEAFGDDVMLMSIAMASLAGMAMTLISNGYRHYRFEKTLHSKPTDLEAAKWSDQLTDALSVVMHVCGLNSTEVGYLPVAVHDRACGSPDTATAVHGQNDDDDDRAPLVSIVQVPQGEENSPEYQQNLDICKGYVGRSLSDFMGGNCFGTNRQAAEKVLNHYGFEVTQSGGIQAVPQERGPIQTQQRAPVQGSGLGLGTHGPHAASPGTGSGTRGRSDTDADAELVM